MTRISEGFDAGPNGATIDTTNTVFTNKGGTSALTFDSAIKLIGNYSMKIVNAASFGYMQYLWGTAQTNQYARFYYYIDGWPTTGQNIVAQTQSGGTNRAQLTLTSAGKFNLRSPATLKAGGATVYTTGQWVRLEWDLVGTVQTLRIYSGANLHGTTPTEVLSPGAGSITISGFDRIIFGNNSSDTFNQHIDGVEIDSAANPGPYVAPGGPTDEAYINIGGVLTPVDCFIWDGSALIPVDPYVWTGSALV